MTDLQPHRSQVFARLSGIGVRDQNKVEKDEVPIRTVASVPSEEALQTQGAADIGQGAIDVESVADDKFPERDVRVCAFGEVSASPDRFKVTVLVVNKKEHVQDVKNSVSRRVDYVLQTLHNHQVQEGDIQVVRTLSRDGSTFQMAGEITITFVDVHKLQTVCNFLVEKLDSSVTVLPPVVYHSTQNLETLRRRASLVAVENAHRKAKEIASYVSQTIGPPLTIREEQCEEWEGSCDPQVDAHDGQLSIQQRISKAIKFVNVKVFAIYQLKPVKNKHAVK